MAKNRPLSVLAPTNIRRASDIVTFDERRFPIPIRLAAALERATVSTSFGANNMVAPPLARSRRFREGLT